jgi:peptidyl-prolyl cis-trans isomerase SurA
MTTLRALLLFVFSSIAYAESIPLDRVLVVVNDDIVTMRELEEQTSITRARLKQQGTPLPDENTLRQKVLEKLIFEKLQIQSARDAGVVISEDMIDQALANVAQRNRLSIDEVLDKLKDEGVSEKVFRQSLKDQLAVQAIIDKEVKGKVTVNDSEVDAMLERLGQSGQQERLYDLSHILIATPDNASQDEIRSAISRGEEVVSKIRSGAMSFADAAVHFSDAQDAIDGGELGWRSPDQLPTIFTEALEAMSKGDISPILRSPNGIHILMLNDVKGAEGEKQIAVQNNARHILIRATTPAEIRTATARIEELREEVTAGEDFAGLAEKYSEDPGSAAKGGALGWLSNGETVPAFEQAMDSLQPGELSGPIVSPYGVHLIQLIDRREVDVSDKLRREQARTQIANRKSEERYEQWLRELKAKAYIDYRVPPEEL